MAEFARQRQQQHHEAAQTVKALAFLTVKVGDPSALPAPGSSKPSSKQPGPSSVSGPGPHPQAPATTGSAPRWEDEVIDLDDYEDVTSPPPKKAKPAQPPLQPAGTNVYQQQQAYPQQAYPQQPQQHHVPAGGGGITINISVPQAPGPSFPPWATAPPGWFGPPPAWATAAAPGQPAPQAWPPGQAAWNPYGAYAPYGYPAGGGLEQQPASNQAAAGLRVRRSAVIDDDDD